MINIFVSKECAPTLLSRIFQCNNKLNNLAPTIYSDKCSGSLGSKHTLVSVVISMTQIRCAYTALFVCRRSSYVYCQWKSTDHVNAFWPFTRFMIQMGSHNSQFLVITWKQSTHVQRFAPTLALMVQMSVCFGEPPNRLKITTNNIAFHATHWP